MQPSIAQFFATPRASFYSLSAKTQAEIERQQSKSTPRRKKGANLKSIENAGNSSSNTGRPPKLEQMILDVGQKNIGIQKCIKCGMVYSQENPSDVKQHERFHNRFTEVNNFRVTLNQMSAWKESSTLRWEEVTAPVAGTLFILTPMTTATIRRKLESILTKYVNQELVLQPDLPAWDKEGLRRAFVFIASSVGTTPPFVAGVLLVDPIHKLIVMPEQKHFRGEFLGVDRIWVHALQRRKGIATFLLDSARRHLGLPDNTQTEMPKNRLAFSDPSDLGVKLAISYVRSKKEKEEAASANASASSIDSENIDSSKAEEKKPARYIIYSSA